MDRDTQRLVDEIRAAAGAGRDYALIHLCDRADAGDAGALRLVLEAGGQLDRAAARYEDTNLA